jgi:DNA-binding transcriptional LysR family regulator
LPWIVTRSPNSIRNMLEAWFAQQGLELNVVAEVDSLPLLIKAVESDLGVTLSSPTAVRSVGGAIDSLVSTPLPQSSPIRVFSACWRASRSAPTIMRTAEILKDIAAGLQLPKVEP